ncbi:uncharacterized protein EI97DRAFT_239695 [Westerdykella ornata]|uniref:Uncharacterized protein n=1 Tax=Westerdykella ornata TaxID=318751 RepID=A0A6A6J7C5_WESOR|nr:uncharacterized protein EI97DRAFT_239695 [Westerdykella ornata]KAF2271908.1 hypothetical protein EI97DRAFT_239695 [Westerdykella ornata]
MSIQEFSHSPRASGQSRDRGLVWAGFACDPTHKLCLGTASDIDHTSSGRADCRWIPVLSCMSVCLPSMLQRSVPLHSCPEAPGLLAHASNTPNEDLVVATHRLILLKGACPLIIVSAGSLSLDMAASTRLRRRAMYSGALPQSPHHHNCHCMSSSPASLYSLPGR